MDTEKILVKKYRPGQYTYLSKERFQWLFKNFADMCCKIQLWSTTLRSIRDNKRLHYYLSNHPRTKGVQTTFFYENKKNGKKVIILTTYDPKTETAKVNGLGWVLIVDPNSPRPFFWFPLRRTLRFIDRILFVTKVMIAIVDHWPTCPECGCDLVLKQVDEEMLMREFYCKNKAHHFHPRPKFWITKIVFPQELQIYSEFLNKRFEEYYMYRQRDEEQGIIRDYQCVIRAKRNAKNLDTNLAVTENVYRGDVNDYLKDGNYYE